ncbi:MAG: hypothetical protein ACXV7F_13080, partial [Methylomonas sp.]
TDLDFGLLHSGHMLDMDELFSIIWAMIHWRFMLSVLISIGMAFFLSSAIQSFTSGYCVSLVGIGSLFGLYGQGKAG